MAPHVDVAVHGRSPTFLAAGWRWQRQASSNLSYCLLDAVSSFSSALLPRAMGATKHLVLAFNTVAENGAAAMSAPRRHCVSCAFETIERATILPTGDGEGLVVFVSAGVTDSHEN